MYQTLWGRQLCQCQGPTSREEEKVAKLCFSVIWGWEPRWRLARGFVTAVAALMDWIGAHGSWVEWSWLSPLLSFSLLFQSSFFKAFLFPPFQFWRVIYFLSRNMVRLDVCQSHRKPGLIGSALPLSDFLDGFVCVCVVCCCVGFSVGLLFLNPSAHFGA